MEKRQNHAEPSDENNAILPNIQIAESGEKWIKEECELPTFPEEVYSNLPPFLKECVANSLSDDDRPTILLGALTCLSACFPNVSGIYDQRTNYPNLYFFLVANAGMGKGALTLCRELVAPINRELLELTKNAMIAYKEAKKVYAASKNKADMEAPEEPPLRMLIIPANSSAASFQKILGDNGGVGLLFETEGDTLGQTLKADYGNYSDVLRKGFHHEQVSFSRRTDNAFMEIEAPQISTVLAGTPDQVTRLIPDAENGLLSRFMFLFLPFKRSFRNVFACDDTAKSKNEIFRMLGEKFKMQRNDFLARGNFSFSISPLEQMMFLDTMSKMNEECCEEVDNGMQAVVRRLADIAYRIMMILSAVRQLGVYVPRDRNDTSVTPLVCSTEDFETAMSIINVLAYHSVFIYRRQSSLAAHPSSVAQQSKADEKRMKLFNLLPSAFSKMQYSEIVKSIGAKESTTDKWLTWYIDKGLLARVGQSAYQKTEGKKS